MGMAKKTARTRGPAGYGLSGPEPQGTGAFPWGGGSGKNALVDGRREKVRHVNRTIL